MPWGWRPAGSPRLFASPRVVSPRVRAVAFPIGHLPALHGPHPGQVRGVDGSRPLGGGLGGYPDRWAAPHRRSADHRGCKALSTPLRRTFGADVAIPRCQVHNARNIIDRRPAKSHPSVRAALRPAWETEDADKAEQRLRARARRFEDKAPDVSRSILEGLDEILTLVRLGLPPELRRSLASTNIIESMHSVVRRTCRNVKRWRDAHMTRRWTATGMLEAQKGVRRVKAYQQIPLLREALIKQRQRRKLDTLQDAASSP